MLRRTLGTALATLVLLSGWVRPAAAVPAPPVVPIGRSPLADSPAPTRVFQPPAKRWQSGHRGVDLPGRAGESVLAAASGRVTFAGQLAGRGVVVIEHGSVRTTYEPVQGSVRVGDRVTAGQRIGVLLAGHAGCAAAACLHWGLRAGEDYLDPMLMVGPGNPRVRLLPSGAVSTAERRAAERARAAAAAAAASQVGGGPAPPPGASGLVRPADGPITSPYGMRRHPVLGVWKLHDGTDFGTGCGAPLRATADGVVSDSYYNAGYGNRLLIDHGEVRGRRIRSAYNHAIRYLVSPGQSVRAGQVIGLSGSTGYSTGCHLHFMLWVDDQLVDPARWL
ncbi:M23 family metallopeptidase [Enemella dayhoffiae]|nr:peptidoglycan DD-metalloendopeptidase family protein [Enemella dayhoffiae]